MNCPYRFTDFGADECWSGNCTMSALEVTVGKALTPDGRRTADDLETAYRELLESAINHLPAPIDEPRPDEWAAECWAMRQEAAQANGRGLRGLWHRLVDMCAFMFV